MKILFVTELFPFPNRGGEFLRNYGLSKMLQQSEYEIYALLGYYEENSFDKIFDNAEIVEFPNDREFSSLKSVTSKFRKDPIFLKTLKQAIIKVNPDIVYIDYHYYGHYFKYIRSLGCKVIYGTHNIQPLLIIQRPISNLKERIIRFVTFKMYQLHERIYYPKLDALITVSEDDRNHYKRFMSEKKVFSIPNFIDSEEYINSYGNKSNYIIMPANFSAFQNFMGLNWFLENVWDEELSNITEFLIVGKGSLKAYQELSEHKKWRNVRALGEVDDMKPYIGKARATVVPLLHGSGTRLKCIESMALKTQLISTNVGAEGIEHEGSIIIADNPQIFKNEVKEVVLQNKDFTTNAYDIFLKKYSLKGNAKKFDDIIRYVTKIN